jgi:hypothetical protein
MKEIHANLAAHAGIAQHGRTSDLPQRRRTYRSQACGLLIGLAENPVLITFFNAQILYHPTDFFKIAH